MKPRKPRWVRILLVSALGGALLTAGATLATLGTAPFESALRRVDSTAGDIRWSRLSPERLGSLRNEALATALRERETWLHVQHQRSVLPLVYDQSYSGAAPSVAGATFEVITQDELQSRADAYGAYWAYHVSSPEFTWAKATVWVFYRQHLAAGSDSLDFGSRGVKLECVPNSSRWQCSVMTWFIA